MINKTKLFETKKTITEKPWEIMFYETTVL